MLPQRWIKAPFYKGKGKSKEINDLSGKFGILPDYIGLVIKT